MDAAAAVILKQLVTQALDDGYILEILQQRSLADQATVVVTFIKGSRNDLASLHVSTFQSVFDGQTSL